MSGSKSRSGCPTTPTVDLMKAFYAHGTLELHVPRSEIEPRRVPIEHRSPFVGNPNAQAC